MIAVDVSEEPARVGPRVDDCMSRRSFAGLRLIVGERTAAVPSGVWFHNYICRQTGALLMSCARRPDGYLLRSYGVGDFTVSSTGTDVLCNPEAGASDSAIDEAFLHAVVPLVESLRGHDGLHASAVEVGSKAIAFAGFSMAGKSTLTAYIGQLGYRVLCDDYVGLEARPDGVYLKPGARAVRLRDDAPAGLAQLPRTVRTAVAPRIDSASASVTRVGTIPLGRIYCLTRDAHSRRRDVQLVRFSPADAFIALMHHSHRLDIHDPAVLRRQADLLTRVVREDAVRSLTIGHGFDLLPVAAERIMEDLAS
jgi:hypothetical protein